MTLFKKKKSKPHEAIYYTLDTELIRARRKKETSFYYPLEEHEVSKAMSWGIRNRIAVKLDHVTGGKNYYKFFGFSLDSQQKLLYNK